MILTGHRIATGVSAGDITIDPFIPEYVEPNSYRVTLGSRLLDCATDMLDARSVPPMAPRVLADVGRVLEPGRFYLGETGEILGSTRFASTLYATRSLASIGMWLHFSAPLGHTGAVIRWTLEIRVAQRIVVYPGMIIGKIAFWHTQGKPVRYRGRYQDSTTVRRSALRDDRLFHRARTR
ncbi:MAG TPA: deoxycytidine triphosphate deaminase [Pseudonocardiaceae bacterium]|nr:deoxycytidine triphosphate deaminase [Pseudonocardiaceae bacterium]